MYFELILSQIWSRFSAPVCIVQLSLDAAKITTLCMMQNAQVSLDLDVCHQIYLTDDRMANLQWES